MAWTAPPTFTAGTPLTAAMMNVLRDNMLETAPAKATTQDSIGRYFVSAGTTLIAERRLIRAVVATSETTGSFSFTDLATTGPTNASLTTGQVAVVIPIANMGNSGSGNTCRMGFEVTGASSIAASANRATSLKSAAANADARIGAPVLVNSLTAGSNTFTSKYVVDAGTGTFVNRELIVWPF